MTTRPLPLRLPTAPRHAPAPHRLARRSRPLQPAPLLFSFLLGANLALGLLLVAAATRGPAEPRLLIGLLCACPLGLAALCASLTRAVRPTAAAPAAPAVWEDPDAALWSRPTQPQP